MAVDALARALAAGKVPVDAYQMAVAGGYTGTKEEFEADMGQSGTNATNAANSASAAAASATTASNAAANLAPTYSSSATYAVGDHVLYNGGYYICNSAITTAEAWTAAHWTAVKVGPEITDLQNALSGLEEFCYEQKTIILTKNYTIPSNNILNTASDPIVVDIPTGTSFGVLLDGVVDNIQYTASLRDANGDEIEYFNAYTGLVSSRTAIGNIKSIRLYSNKSGLAEGDLYILSVNYNVSAGGENSVEYRLDQLDSGIEANKSRIDDLDGAIDDKVSEESMDLCDLETVPASANLWNYSQSVSGGGILANGTFYEDANYCYQIIDVTEGDTLYFYNLQEAQGISACRWLCAYDTNGEPVPASGSNSSINSYLVPTGITSVSIAIGISKNNNFMVITNESTPPSEYIPYRVEYNRYVATEEFLKNINLGTNTVEVPIYTTVQTDINWTDGYYAANGTYYSDTSYQYSQKISVSAGDVLKPVGDSNSYFRFVCAYNGNSVIAGSGSNSSIKEYQVPSGVDGVVVSTSKSYNIPQVSIKHQTGIEEKTYPITQPLGKFNWEGDLADGDSVELLSSNVRFDTIWNFTGHVTTMGKIIIGNKSGNTITELLSVDATNVYYKALSGDVTAPHGLTISGDLTVRIECDMRVNYLKGVTIISLGESFTIAENTAYSREMYGSPYLESVGAVMTDCAFSWIPKNIDKPIWVFGDSWVSMYDTRWPYYMKEAGYTNCWMLNGFAGENTKEGLTSFKNLLSIRKPDYLVWLYGMNDRDNGAVNADWKSAYDEVISICDDYDITLILYTVPNTPTIDNNYKNAIVMASGYRYIDGVAAVGDDGEGNWFTGYEQSVSDHNHTSAKGAKALFMRILADFPEIAGNGI